MSNLIVEVDSEYILLADGTRIEINMSYDEYGNGNPCGFIIRDAVEQSVRPTNGELCAVCNKPANCHEDHDYVAPLSAISG